MRINQNLGSVIDLGDSIDGGQGENPVFPFIYAMYNNEDDQWIPSGDTDNNMIGYGPYIAPASSLQWIIKTRTDHPFKMLWTKYSVLYDTTTDYHWYDNEVGWSGIMEGDYQTVIGTPLLRFLSVAMYVASDSRYLQGGRRVDFSKSQESMIRVPCSAIQGYEYGYSNVYGEFLVPAGGLIVLDLHNSHATKGLYVSAAIYGMKVRV